MEWLVKIHRKANRFLEELSMDERKRVEEKIKEPWGRLGKASYPIAGLIFADLGASRKDFSDYA